MKLDNVKILGFKSYIDSISGVLSKINSIKKEGEFIQLFNADAIAGFNHIYHGVNQAFLAFNRGENLANDLNVEIVVRCSCQRQISKAFDILGLKEGQMNLCVVLINCKDDYLEELSEIFTFDEDVLNPDYEKLCQIYNISSCGNIENRIIDKITRLIVDY